MSLKILEHKIVRAAGVYIEAQKEIDQKLRLLGERKPSKGAKVKPPTRFTLVMREVREQRLGFRQRITELEKIKKEVEDELVDLTQDHPVWYNFLEYVKGIGLLSTGLLIAVSGDIERVNSASGFWKSFGIDVDNETGRARKLKPGKQGTVGFTPARMVLGRIRVTIFRLGQQGKAGKLYELYETIKEKSDRLHPDWPEGRRIGDAIRRWEKIFLACVWKVMREAHRLEAREPYILSIAPHSKLITPIDLMDVQAVGRHGRQRKAT